MEFVAGTTYSGLPAWSQCLISELEAADRRAEELARTLNREQLNWSPTPGAWSIGQCLEHLLRGNEILLPAIAISLDGRQQSQVREVTLGWFSRWFIRNYIALFLILTARGPGRPRRSGLQGMSSPQSLTPFFAATKWRESSSPGQVRTT